MPGMHIFSLITKIQAKSLLLSHGTQHSFGSSECTQGSYQEMRVLSEHGIVAYCGTKSFDFLSDLSFDVVESHDGIRNGASSFVHVLDWTWIGIVVDELPGSFVSFQDLIWLVRKADFL